MKVIYKLLRRKAKALWLPRLPRMEKPKEIVYAGEILKDEGYVSFGNRGKVNIQKYDYKSGCCGVDVHIETSGGAPYKYVGFACRKCGRGLNGNGVFLKEI